MQATYSMLYVASKKSMYKVYVLESVRTRKWYIGFTPSDVIKRLNRHNKGEIVSSKSFRPWKLIYYESYLNRKDATGREKFLKSGAGKNFLKKQLKYYLLGLPRASGASYTRAASSMVEQLPLKE